MTIRVVQWTTGNVGKQSVEAVMKRPDLELVGCYAWSEDKSGKDIGELCGLPAIGLTATNDVDSLLALEPDCVIYNPMWFNVDEMVRILESGANMVATAAFINGQSYAADGLAEHIDGARYVELDSADHVPWASSADIPGEIEEFLTGTRQMAPSDRVLATVLFSDIVGSTQQASALGDRVWTARLEEHDRAIDRQLGRFDGYLVKRMGDGVLAIFDGPARGVQCAVAIRDALRQLGIDVRVGLHTGEIERRGDDVAGIAVHLAQRVQAKAEAGEVLVSRTVVDLVVGSDLLFVDRGECGLKGLPGIWRLFLVAS